MKWVLGALAAVAVAGGASAAPQGAVASLLPELRSAMDGTLIDYTKARFRSVHITTSGDMVCGLVNSPNQFGGFTGWMPFIGGPKKGGGAFVVVATDDLTASVMGKDCGGGDSKWLAKDFAADLSYRR